MASEDAAILLGRTDRTREQIEALFGDGSHDFWRRTWPGLVEAALTERGWHPDNIRMAVAGPSLALQLLRAVAEGQEDQQ